MDQDERKQAEEEIKRQKDANDSELSDSELENVAGGKGGGGGNTIQPMPPTTPG